MSEDSVRAHFKSTVTLPHQDAVIRMHVVAKRVDEADREVVVCCFTNSDSNGCLNDNEGVQVQGCGWTIIESASSGNDGSEGESTMVQSVVQVTFELKSSQPKAEDMATNAAVLRSFGHHFDRLRQLLENLVLAESFMSWSL